MRNKFNIPNAITSLRIIGSVVLCFLFPMSLSYLICYVVCAVTDAVDGFIARKFDMSSSFGSKLDSIADMFFIAAILVTIIPLSHLNSVELWWIGIIVLLRLISIGVARQKYSKFVPGLHTYLNKFTGFLLYFIPVEYYLFNVNIVVYIICGAATFSAFEEILINVYSKELNVNIKGFWELIGK